MIKKIKIGKKPSFSASFDQKMQPVSLARWIKKQTYLEKKKIAVRQLLACATIYCSPTALLYFYYCASDLQGQLHIV
jgi:hypothetical protein